MQNSEYPPIVSPSTGVVWYMKQCPECGHNFYGPEPELPEHVCDDEEDE